MKASKEKTKDTILRSIASLTARGHRCRAAFPLKIDGAQCIRRQGHSGKHLTRFGQLWHDCELQDVGW